MQREETTVFTTTTHSCEVPCDSEADTVHTQSVLLHVEEEDIAIAVSRVLSSFSASSQATETATLSNISRSNTPGMISPCIERNQSSQLPLDDRKIFSKVILAPASLTTSGTASASDLIFNPGTILIGNSVKPVSASTPFFNSQNTSNSSTAVLNTFADPLPQPVSLVSHEGQRPLQVRTAIDIQPINSDACPNVPRLSDASKISHESLDDSTSSTPQFSINPKVRIAHNFCSCYDLNICLFFPFLLFFFKF